MCELKGFLSPANTEHVTPFMKIPRTDDRPVASGGAGGACAPPLFDRSVNPISTRGGTLSPPSTTCPPAFSELATALDYTYNN